MSRIQTALRGETFALRSAIVSHPGLAEPPGGRQPYQQDNETSCWRVRPIASHGHSVYPRQVGGRAVQSESSRKGRNALIGLGIILAFLAALLISGSLRLGVTVEVGKDSKGLPGVNGK